MTASQGTLRAWIDTFAADVKTVDELLAEPNASGPARVLAAAALSYLVTRLDLIPDWEAGIGVVDDAMVLRVACALATERGLGKPSEALGGKVAALGKQAADVDALLGKDLAPKFRKYVEALVLPATVVRGRTASQIVENAKLREKLMAEVQAEVLDELRAKPPTPITDDAAATKILLNHLTSKLSSNLSGAKKA